jgi:hypothetical protein
MKRTAEVGFVEKRQRYSAIRTICAAVGLAVILACGQGPGTGGDHYSGPPGLAIASSTGVWVNVRNYAPGENFQLPIAVMLLPGEQPGDSVTVTPGAPHGVTVSPPSIVTTLPAGGGKTYITFTASVESNALQDSTLITANRTFGQGSTINQSLAVYAEAPLNIVEDLVDVTLTPPAASVAPGGFVDFDLAILPRGNTHGDVAIYPAMHVSGPGPEGWTVTPDVLHVNMVQGSSVPVHRTVRLAALNSGAEAGQFRIGLGYGVVVATANIGVSTGVPTFTFSATPTVVYSANGVESNSVEFSVESINGLAGVVRITSEADGEVSEVPSIGEVLVTLQAGDPPHTFTRKYARYYGTEPNHVTYTANHAGSGITRTVTITVRDPI